MASKVVGCFLFVLKEISKERRNVLTFQSILFKFPKNLAEREADFFHDLNIDQIVNTLTAFKKEYKLKALFYTIPTDREEVLYRQEVMKDLENPALFQAVERFANEMHRSRLYKSYSEKLTNKFQKERWCVDSIDVYLKAVSGLLNELKMVKVESQGFSQFKDYLTSYVESDDFQNLISRTQDIISNLSKIKYTLFVKENRVKVQKYRGESNYSEETLKTFERFKQDAVKDYTVEFDETMDMNGVEEKIVEQVAKLYSEEFSTLDAFCSAHLFYADNNVLKFDKEIQFYMAYLERIEPLKKTGLSFCYPEFTHSKNIYDYEAFDLALAFKTAVEGKKIIQNDFYLGDQERLIVITGPNQGGKTTFARMFGQIHYLAKMGYPVPGSRARLFFYDNIFTHFEKEEKIGNLRGKLEDDLVRIKKIIDNATSESIIIMNEIFSSTTLEDAKLLAKKVIEEIMKKGSIGLLVTFIYELTKLNDKIVSMVSTVSPENPEIRTYKIVRKKSDGLSYAVTLARKYGLTYEQLKKRVKDESVFDVQR
jgi:DNA mismatch repair protein MutS